MDQSDQGDQRGMMGNKSLINSPAISQEVNNVMVSARAWGSFFFADTGKQKPPLVTVIGPKGSPTYELGDSSAALYRLFGVSQTESVRCFMVLMCVCMCALTGAVRHFFTLVLSQYRAIIDSLEAFNPFVLVWDALSRRDDEKFQNLHENCMNTFFGGICLQVMGLI